MLHYFNREELYCGTSAEKFDVICAALNDEKMEYTTKIVNGSFGFSAGRTRSTTNLSGGRLFYIYVSKKQIEEAAFLMNRAMRRET